MSANAPLAFQDAASLPVLLPTPPEINFALTYSLDPALLPLARMAEEFALYRGLARIQNDPQTPRAVFGSIFSRKKHIALGVEEVRQFGLPLVTDVATKISWDAGHVNTLDVAVKANIHAYDQLMRLAQFRAAGREVALPFIPEGEKLDLPPLGRIGAYPYSAMVNDCTGHWVNPLLNIYKAGSDYPLLLAEGVCRPKIHWLPVAKDLPRIEDVRNGGTVFDKPRRPMDTQGQQLQKAGTRQQLQMR